MESEAMTAGGPRTEDRVIGGNVARLRGEMPQKALAEQMRARGHKWSQATVWSVEKGDRPLRFSEAVSLSEVFGAPLGELRYDPDKDRLDALLLDAARRREAVVVQLIEIQDAATVALDSWREAVDRYREERGPERLEMALADTGSQISQRTEQLKPDILLSTAEGLVMFEAKNSSRAATASGAPGGGR